MTPRITLRNVYGPQPALYRLRPCQFLCLVLLAVGLAALGSVFVFSPIWPIRLTGIVLDGLMFAHFVELQHQCLHCTATGNRGLDRALGTVLGLPMLVSFSDYQRAHLEHHRKLGTSENEEFFAYQYGSLRSWGGIAKHFLMLPHYGNVARRLYQLSFNHAKCEGLSRRIRTEYILIGAWLMSNALCIVMGHLALLQITVVPLVIAVPCHALIELPEHWGCRQVGAVVETTRSIRACRLGVWFTNGNNYHVEHHLHAGVPNHNFSAVHESIREGICFLSTSYPAFYWQFLKDLWSGLRNKGMADPTSLQPSPIARRDRVQ